VTNDSRSWPKSPNLVTLIIAVFYFERVDNLILARCETLYRSLGPFTRPILPSVYPCRCDLQ